MCIRDRFDKQSDRIQDIFGLDKLRFWDREPRYREFWALRNINLTVPKGERIGIIGRNGAGKSTLLKLIVGNLRPTEGSIHVNGKIQALLQIGTGFHPEFTGIENIRTALAYAGMDAKKIKSCMDEIIEFSELEDYIHQPVKYYSAGMYSRLAFAVSTSLAVSYTHLDVYKRQLCGHRRRRQPLCPGASSGQRGPACPDGDRSSRSSGRVPGREDR